MKKLVAVTLFAASVAFAQTPQGGATARPPGSLDSAKSAVYYERYADEMRAKQAMENARTSLKSRKYREALASGDVSLHVTADRFVTAGGVSFVAMQAGLPPTLVRAGSSLTFFGQILGSDGRVLSDFELPSPVLDSKGDPYVEHSLIAGATATSARLGVAMNGAVIGVASCTFPSQNDGASQLIVSNNIYNMARAQNPFEPFAFGGTKVVPKPDRSFRRADEAWLFVEWRDEKTVETAPPLSIRVIVEGADKRLAGSWQPAEVSALKGVGGHFGIGTTVDLSSLAPGDYTIKLLVRDANTKQTVERDQPIVIVE